MQLPKLVHGPLHREVRSMTSAPQVTATFQGEQPLAVHAHVDSICRFGHLASRLPHGLDGLGSPHQRLPRRDDGRCKVAPEKRTRGSMMRSNQAACACCNLMACKPQLNPSKRSHRPVLGLLHSLAVLSLPRSSGDSVMPLLISRTSTMPQGLSTYHSCPDSKASVTVASVWGGGSQEHTISGAMTKASSAAIDGTFCCLCLSKQTRDTLPAEVHGSLQLNN